MLFAPLGAIMLCRRFIQLESPIKRVVCDRALVGLTAPFRSWVKTRVVFPRVIQEIDARIERACMTRTDSVIVFVFADG